MRKILSDCTAMCADIDRAVGGEATDLRDRMKVAREEFAATIPKRVRSWNTPEGERVANMKVRLANIDSLIARLDDIASITEILAEDILRLESK